MNYVWPAPSPPDSLTASKMLTFLPLIIHQFVQSRNILGEMLGQAGGGVGAATWVLVFTHSVPF